jgi:hypothetical protein
MVKASFLLISYNRLPAGVSIANKLNKQVCFRESTEFTFDGLWIRTVWIILNRFRHMLAMHYAHALLKSTAYTLNTYDIYGLR